MTYSGVGIYPTVRLLQEVQTPEQWSDRFSALENKILNED
jgi:hypothetical protein